ncbi:hypothetical protein AUP74_02303 [Microbulbifer aggregans]|uniref:DUF4174 domain-containing protein n=1 Tax=Microbulbifer aggregans TaxID=1769779 RepID=A0A1C9W992_9GAMM|nr:DUF4174 domain-containing protein [Microbulbifer aggregans]AOS97711.1 hypothetical protein AUP74_02303 [Microbulbifer aggregans]
MPLQSLDQLQWKNRILLVRAATETDGAARELREAEAGVTDRDMVWFIVAARNIVQTNYPGALAEDFADKLLEGYFPQAGDNVVLIGKDGGVKHRAPELNLENVFSLIDAMPMRKQEIER